MMSVRTRKHKQNRFTRKTIVMIYVIVIIVLFAWIYILPNVFEAFKKTDIINYGGIQVKDDVTGYFVRSETVYYARNTGQIQYFASEGDQLRQGGKVLDISSDASGYIAEKRGMLSYFLDGQESFFTPETMLSLKKDTVSKLKVSTEDTTRDNAKAGEPIYKIVDSNNWYVIAWIKKESIIKYEKGKSINLMINKDQVSGIIDDIIKSEDDFMIILKFNHYSPQMAQLRKLKTQVITADYKGLIIKNMSIRTIEDTMGVYVKDVSGNFIFKPVNVIISDGEYSLVDSGYYDKIIDGVSKRVETVDIYDEVLKSGEPY